MLMAPVVHLQDGLFHAHTGHTFFQFLEKDRPGHIQRLVIDAQRQHKVLEHQFGHLFAPRHLLTRLKSGAHVLQIELYRIVRHVGQRHVGIQEFQCGLFLIGHFQALQVGRP